MAEKIRIKDIAERAGVSVGTVDRVLHDRPNVSKPARDKVEKALKEMNYQPNVYASALAYNKSYTFYLLIPKHESEAYWEEIEEGAKKCEDTRRDFHIDVEIRFYERSNEESFREEGNKILEASPEGVIVVPSSLDVTREFTEALHHKSIPFILLDSYMPDLRPLSFFGQDSFCSGFFAAKMLMMLAAKEDEILLMRQTKDGRVVSKQQDNREVGFRHYMHDHFPNVKITLLDLPLSGTRAEFVKMLEKFFAVTSEHPPLHHHDFEGAHRGRLPAEDQPPRRSDHGLRYGGEKRPLSARRKHLLPHRPARLHAGLLLRRHALPGHRAEEESYTGKLYAYRAADEGKCRFLSQNPALRLSGRTGFPHERIFLQEHYKL